MNRSLSPGTTHCLAPSLRAFTQTLW